MAKTKESTYVSTSRQLGRPMDGPTPIPERDKDVDPASVHPSDDVSRIPEKTPLSRIGGGRTEGVRGLGTAEMEAIRISDTSRNPPGSDSESHPEFDANVRPIDNYKQHSHPNSKDVLRNGDEAPEESAAARDRRLQAIEDLCLDPSDLPFRRETFNEYTKLVKRVFRTASAMVSIIRDDVYMIMDKGTPRIADLHMTLCARTLTVQKGIVVQDLSQDCEMRQNPIWESLADYPIKFYAGAPLTVHFPDSPPVVIGTLCVLDEKPRPDFSEESLETLAQLASMLVKNICAEQSELYAHKAARMHAVTSEFMLQAIMPGPTSTGPAGPSNDETHPARSTQKPTGRFRDNTTARESGETKLLVEPDEGDDNEDDINNSIYEQAILSICEILDDSAVALLDTTGYRIFLRQTDSDANGQVLESLTENIGSKGFLDSEMGSRLSRLDGRLKDIADEDIVVKKIERSVEEQTQIPSEVLAFRLADVAFESPFQLESSESSEFTDAICDILEKTLKISPLWLDKGDTDPQSVAIFKRIAPRAQCMLVHPLWNTDGSPLKLLLIAWGNGCQRKEEIQDFTASIVTGLAAALTLRKARRMEQAQIAFGNVQAHELRTPIHQLQNMTAVLKSSLNENRAVQKVEMKEGLEDIENASIQLEAVMRNILSYFELESDFSPAKVRWEAFGLEKQAPRSLEQTLNDILLSLAARDTKRRENNAGKTLNIEVILEIVPPFLGDTLQEDITGNFARSIGNIVQNALAYIEEAGGYVLIVVDDVPSLLPPQGFSDMSTTRNVSIKICDTGIGISPEYLKYHYFRPLKKGNELRAGSGLSVHVARRLLKTLGGSMAVSSQAGMGTTVHIEVPLARRHSTDAIAAEHHASNSDPAAIQTRKIGTPRNVYLLGFFEDGCTKGVRCAGEVLGRSIERLGCKRAQNLGEADFVFFNIGCWNPAQVQEALVTSADCQVVLLFKDEQLRQGFDTSGLDHDIICLHRPLLPSTLRALLFETEGTLQSAGVKPPPGFKPTEEPAQAVSATAIAKGEQETALPAVTAGPQRHPVSGDGSKSNKIPVIVVEDNRINRKILVQYLKKMNVESLEACDGEEAVRIFQELQEPCIVLLDINMPEMDGFTACEHFRKFEQASTRRRSQVIAVTALNRDEDRNRGLQECGMDAWLVKPTNRKQIVDVVEQGMKALASQE